MTMERQCDCDYGDPSNIFDEQRNFTQKNIRLGRGYGIFFTKLKFVVEFYLPILKNERTLDEEWR